MMKDEEMIRVKQLLQHLNNAAMPFNATDCTEYYSNIKTDQNKTVHTNTETSTANGS